MRKDQFLVLQELLSSLKSRKWKFRYRPYVSPISTVKRSLDTVSSTAVVAPDSNCNIRHGPRRTMVSRALRQTLWFRSWPFFFGLEERTFTALTDLVYIYLNFFLGFPRLFMCVVFNLTSFGFSCLIKVLHLKEVIWFLNAQKYNSFHFPFTLKAHISSLSRLALFFTTFSCFLFTVLSWVFSRCSSFFLGSLFLLPTPSLKHDPRQLFGILWRWPDPPQPPHFSFTTPVSRPGKTKDDAVWYRFSCRSLVANGEILVKVS